MKTQNTFLSAFTRELRMQKRLRHITIGATIAGLIMVSAFLVTLYYVNRVFNDSYNAHVTDFIDKFSIAVTRQVEGDMNALSTLSLFMNDVNSVSDEVIRKTQHLNNFGVIAYWGKDGINYHLNIKGVWKDSRASHLHPEHKAVIDRALAGETCISAPFHSLYLDEDVIVYSSPVLSHDGKSVVGAVSISKYLSAFEPLATELGADLEHVGLFLADASGVLFGESTHSVFTNCSLQSICALNLLNPEEQTIVQDALNAHERLTLHFTYEGEDYNLFIRPIGINDWSALALDSPDFSKAPVFGSIRTVFSMLIALFFVSILVSIFVYTLLRDAFIRQMATTYYDPVTGGYNMRKFLNNLSTRYLHHGDHTFVCVNIKDFRYINDYAGHDNADILLKSLHDALLSSDKVLLCCRDHADLFFALINSDNEEEVRTFLIDVFNKVSNDFKEHFTLFPVIFYSGAVVMRREDDTDTLTHKMRFMQRQIRPSYIPTVVFYDEKAHLSELKYRNIETYMRGALANHEFKVYLQPKCPPHRTEPTAAEALVRWVRPDGSLLYPNDFIPVFEKNGFCMELDLYVLEEVCKQVRIWIDKGYPPLHVSVNQSKRLLFRPDYLDRVREMLQRYALPSHTIVIEILETILAQDIESLSTFVREMRDCGLAVSMDDFGSGYSSLNMISSLDLDEIKFDKEFLLESDPVKKAKNKLILSQMLSLIRTFNIRTVVEGVETEEDVDFLQKEGVDLAQGYYFSRPIPMEQFEELYLKPSSRT